MALSTGSCRAWARTKGRRLCRRQRRRQKRERRKDPAIYFATTAARPPRSAAAAIPQPPPPLVTALHLAISRRRHAQWWRNGRIGGSKGTWHCNDFLRQRRRCNSFPALADYVCCICVAVRHDGSGQSARRATASRIRAVRSVLGSLPERFVPSASEGRGGVGWKRAVHSDRSARETKG